MNACFIIAVWCARPACASGVHVTFATCCEMSRIGMHIALCARDRTRRWRRTDTHCALCRAGAVLLFIWSSIRSIYTILYCTIIIMRPEIAYVQMETSANA